MPKDDWAKYKQRDRVRKLLATGQYERVEPVSRPKRKKLPKKPKHATCAGFVIRYNRSTPHASTMRIIVSGPIHLGTPPWPGFS